MKEKIFYLALFLLCLSISFSCKTSRGALRENNFIQLLADSDAENLASAADQASKIDDPLSKFHLLSEISSTLVKMNKINLASIVLKEAESTVSLVRSESARIELYPLLAKGYITVGQVEKGAQLLKRTLVILDESFEERVAGNILKQIVSFGFMGGEAAFDLPGEAIQKALVLQNLEIRLDLLIYAAEQYRKYNIGLFSDTLIQQAIPAGGSIENIWSKALGMTRLAVLIHETGDPEYAKQIAIRGIRGIENITVIVRPEEEARKIVNIAANLSALEMPDAALNIAETIEYPKLRAEAYAKMALEWDKKNDLIRSELYLEMALEIAKEIEDPYRKILSLLQIGDIASALNNGNSVIGKTYNLLPPLLGELEEPLERERGRFVYLEWIIRRRSPEKALARINELSSYYDRTLLYINAAEKFIELGAHDSAVDAVSLAEKEALKSEFLQGQLYSDAAIIMFRLEMEERAKALLNRIQDPYTLGLAFVACQRIYLD